MVKPVKFVVKPQEIAPRLLCRHNQFGQPFFQVKLSFFDEFLVQRLVLCLADVGGGVKVFNFAVQIYAQKQV